MSTASFPRRALLRLAAMAPLMAACPGDETVVAQSSTPEPAAVRPNIVIIVLDDLDTRAVASMPNVQRLLVERGVSFANCLTTLPGCAPARASILRGQYAHNHGLLRSSGEFGGHARFAELDLETSTVATWLQAVGYRSGLVGKYLNGYPDGATPTHVPAGWDDWYAAAEGEGEHGGVGYLKPSLNENGELVTYTGRDRAYSTDIYAGHAVDFVRRAAADDRPFFAYIVPRAPHTPAKPAPRHEGLFADTEAPRSPAFDEADVLDKPTWIRDSPALTDEEVAELDELQRGRLQSLQAADELVAAVVAAVEEAGALDRTFVVFTSDNGFNMGEHRQAIEKATPHEESIRVPLVVRGPGVEAGRIEERVATNADLAPTFAALAGAAAPEFVDGRSLVPLLAGDPGDNAWRRSVLVEYFLPREGDRLGGDRLDEGDPEASSALGRHGVRAPAWNALRTAEEVYVEYATGETELYDLAADPHQLENLSAGVDPARLVELSARLEALVRCRSVGCRAAYELRFAGPDEVPPLPRILAPAVGKAMPLGSVVRLGGEALDGRGAPVPGDGLAWTVLLRQADGTETAVGEAVGGEAEVVLPPTPRGTSIADWRLEIRLTATDANGLSRTVTVDRPVDRR